MIKTPLLLDSITDASASAKSEIIVSGSHGGLYPAVVASRVSARAVIFNDAGIGLERAGVEGVEKLAETGMAAAAVDCHSCHIGSANDMLARGKLSVVNQVAAELGLEAGQSVEAAIALLQHATMPFTVLPTLEETRQTIQLKDDTNGLHLAVELLDSASMVGIGDTDKVIITGSHGALIGGNPERALKANARVAIFNDAGHGCDGIGVTRLPALNSKNIAAATVSCLTARIGNASSALNTGELSDINSAAAKLGASKGQPLREWLLSLCE